MVSNVINIEQTNLRISWYTGLVNRKLCLNMLVYLSLAVAILAAFVFAISTNPKAVRLSEILFLSGTLAFLLNFARIVGFK